LRTANEHLTVQILRAQHRPPQTVTPEQGLIQAVAQLPTRAQIPAVLGQVLQQAQAAGVELEKGHIPTLPLQAAGLGAMSWIFRSRRSTRASVTSSIGH